MELKTEKTVAYCLAAILLVVGVVCYAAFPQKKPEDPIRIMLKSAGGTVLFDHKAHASEDGYGIDCTECHHMWEKAEGTKPEACTECHTAEAEGDMPKLSDAFHKQCISCHEDDGTAPVECSACHAF
jgi:hypothetical protein